MTYGAMYGLLEQQPGQEPALVIMFPRNLLEVSFGLHLLLWWDQNHTSDYCLSKCRTGLCPSYNTAQIWEAAKQKCGWE